MYESAEARSRAIEAGAYRPASALVADVSASHDRLAAALQTLDEEHWKSRVEIGQSRREARASDIPEQRRVEVEVHHVDLDLDYTLAHLPADFVTRMLERIDDYLSFGVPHVWVLDPYTKRAFDYFAGGMREANDGFLRTDNPQIAVPLAEIFS